MSEPIGAGSGRTTEVRRFAHRVGWEGHVHVLGRCAAGFVAGHADLYLENVYMCRIVLPRQFDDEWIAANVLQAKAVDWIEDWHRREHSGDTGFSEL